MRGMYVVCTMHVLVVCSTGFLARYSRVPLYERAQGPTRYFTQIYSGIVIPTYSEAQP